MEKMNVYVAESLSEALKIKAETGARVLAGGTDLMVQYRTAPCMTPEMPFAVLIISNLDEMKGIKREDDGVVVIGALSTPAEIASSPLVPYHVRMAASRMGAPALRNSATIGGNIANASPKGDLPQPLILLDASLVLVSQDGERQMPVDEFITGSKKTKLKENEIIKEIRIPEVKANYLMYRKIGTRRANAISKLSLSALAFVEDGVIKDFRASSGAAGPKVRRNREVESLLIGKKRDELDSVLAQFLTKYDSIISPHAMPEYRRNTTRRMLIYFIEKIKQSDECGVV